MNGGYSITSVVMLDVCPGRGHFWMFLTDFNPWPPALEGKTP